MGKGFGQLAKLRGIVTYKLSPYEQKPFAHALSHGVPNTLRRISENVLYIAPPLILGYLFYDQIEKLHYSYMRKNPADFENDK